MNVVTPTDSWINTLVNYCPLYSICIDEHWTLQEARSVQCSRKSEKIRNVRLRQVELSLTAVFHFVQCHSALSSLRTPQWCNWPKTRRPARQPNVLVLRPASNRPTEVVVRCWKVPRFHPMAFSHRAEIASSCLSTYSWEGSYLRPLREVSSIGNAIENSICHQNDGCPRLTVLLQTPDTGQRLQRN